MGFQATLVWKLLKKERLRGDLQIEVHRFNHAAQAHDRFIVTRGRPICKTSSLESPMSLASGTLKRPLQSGFVVCWAMLNSLEVKVLYPT
jgi:hypothetical protein